MFDIIGGPEMVPENIRRTLAMVQQVDPEAVIAGGCLRDLVLGAPIKDVDVFVGPRFCVSALAFRTGIVARLDLRVDVIARYGDGGGALEAMWEVFSGVPTTYPVQIIRRTGGADLDILAQDFDFGFCQILFDGKHVLVTAAFLKDEANNTATYLSPAGTTRLTRAQARADRWREKYPTRSFVFP